MKSAAHIKSHPIHPILVAFPIAFFTGTLIFDLLGVLKSDETFLITAYYMEIAGIAGGLIAAVPGLIDYFKTIPPDSSAKKRATLHMVVNVTAVIIFTIAFYLRTNSHTSSWTVIGAEIIAMALMTGGGWLGGTLVYRNQIGVDVRYAHSGKWKQENFEDKSGRIQIGTADELKVNQMKLLVFGNTRMVLGRTEDRYVVFSDHCTHRGASLAGGSMICSTVQCPWHGSQFDVNNGAVKAGPAKENIKTFEVVQEGGKLFLNR